jgi:tetratricopeptide (TPR) repeat protein
MYRQWPNRSKIKGMIRVVILLLFGSMLWVPRVCAQAQKAPQTPPPSATPPRSDTAQPDPDQDTEPYRDESGLLYRRNPGSSSSKAEVMDVSPPPDDAKTHPESEEAVHEMEDAAGLLEGDEIGGIEEFHPWDPHKAEKDIEVGDFYFKRQNYRAALDRYQEALYYKNNDAIATYKLATCQEKVGESDDARKSYEAYLKLLPEGPFAADSRKALARIGGASDDKAPNDDKRPELTNRPGSK